MEYDLSFWELPDWRRESSVNPKFLAAAGVCVALLAVFGCVSWAFRSVHAQKRLRDKVAADVKKIAGDAARVQLLRTRVMRWETILKKLDAKARARIVWCNQFAALQSVIPESVTLQRLQLSSQPVEVEEKPKDPPKPAGAASSSSHRPPKTRKVRMLEWRLTLTGVARGDNADQVSEELSQRLATHPDIAPKLESAKLGKVFSVPAKDGQTAGKQFTINCKYKPVRWFDELRKRTEAKTH